MAACIGPGWKAVGATAWASRRKPATLVCNIDSIAKGNLPGAIAMPAARTEIIPYIFYRDVPAALEWLARAFGFKEEMRTGTPSGGMHGEMSLDGQRIMMGQGAKQWGMISPREDHDGHDGGVHLF